MKKKSIVISTLVVMLLMVFAPIASASNVFYFNSRTGAFQTSASNWNNHVQERVVNNTVIPNRFTSIFNNFFQFLSQDRNIENQEPQSPVNNNDNNVQPEKPDVEPVEPQPPVQPEKPAPEKEAEPKEEQPVEIEKPQVPEESIEQPKPQQPKEEPKKEQPKEEPKKDNTNNVVSAQEWEMLEYVNQERAKAGVAPLQMDTDLAKVAKVKSQDMVTNNYFSHTSPTYGSPFDMMRSFGISYRAAAENIAKNSSVLGAHNALMNSQGHRTNILNPNYTHIGIGIVNNNNSSGITVTQMFIRK